MGDSEFPRLSSGFTQFSTVLFSADSRSSHNSKDSEAFLAFSYPALGLASDTGSIWLQSDRQHTKASASEYEELPKAGKLKARKRLKKTELSELKRTRTVPPCYRFLFA